MVPANFHAVLTPPGAGGIAVLAASGPDVLDVLARILTPVRTPESFLSGKLYYGRVVDPDTGNHIDEVIVAVLLPPESSTGMALVEINCHGGTVPVRAVSEALERLGVARVSPEEFMGREVVPTRDSIQREAAGLGLNAATSLAARHLYYQASGALSERLRGALADPKSAREKLEKLLATAAFGIALSTPPTIAVVGLPNVGKSTLANMLVGSERSLVHHEPGTTRDAVASVASVGGVPMRIVDTAGLREALDEIEAAGVRIALDRLRTADLVLWVFDHSRPLEAVESEHLRHLAGKRILAVVNKMDLPGGLPEAMLAGPFGSEPIHACALNGAGREELEKRILTELFGEKLPEAGEAIIFTAELREAVERALGEPGEDETLRRMLER